jgi:hypothetical protein
MTNKSTSPIRQYNLPITKKFRLGKPEYVHGLRSWSSSRFFLLHWLVTKHVQRLQILLINNTSGRNPKMRDRIPRAQRIMVVHLVLTALGAVAVEAQGLVSHQLLAAGVDSSADGNTEIVKVSIDDRSLFATGA